jgi:RimJ/RimL family protein N-acetyltransferase
MYSQLRHADLYRGRLVRLAALDPEKDAEAIARWSHDSQYLRLLDSDPARPATAKAIRADMEKRAERGDSNAFGIHTLAEDKFIGFVGLWVVNWASAEAFVGIGLGERDYWGKGYGTDAMRLALRFAFDELNLQRVSLDAFAYNARAIRSYEKAGFRLEGTKRETTRRDGRRYDDVNMGVLREEWERARV